MPCALPLLGRDPPVEHQHGGSAGVADDSDSYRRMLGHPVSKDIQDSVRGRSSDHKLLVAVTLICRKA